MRFFQRLLWVTAALFIVVNLVLLGRYAVRENNLSRPHAKAKVLLSWAEMVNDVYVFPLSKTLGPVDIKPDFFKFVILGPAINIRNELYEAGIKEIPVQDGERDYWWTRIHFAEYRAIYAKPFAKFILSLYGEKTTVLIFKRQIEDLYQHLDELTKIKAIADPEIRSTRLSDYSGLAMYYMRNCEDFYSWFPKGEIYYKDKARNRHYSQDLKFNRPFFKDAQEQVKRISEVLAGWFRLKNAVIKSHPQDYQTFSNSPDGLKEPLLIYEASTILLANKILNHHFNCNDPLIKLHQESQNPFPKRTHSYSMTPISLDRPQTGPGQPENYTSVFYDLQSMAQSKLVEQTLADQCALQ